MGQTAAVVLLFVMFLAARLLYWFDPVLGIALGVAAAVVAIITMVLSVGSKKAPETETRRMSSNVAWNEEEPPEPMNGHDREPRKR